MCVHFIHGSNCRASELFFSFPLMNAFHANMRVDEKNPEILQFSDYTEQREQKNQSIL